MFHEQLVTKEETKAIQFCDNPCLELFIQQMSKELLQTNCSRTSLIPSSVFYNDNDVTAKSKGWDMVRVRVRSVRSELGYGEG